ncbi:MAG: transposase zinc-binding domain-containing protein, partial [Candidatus Sulfotelmatobacter sp.]
LKAFNELEEGLSMRKTARKINETSLPPSLTTSQVLQSLKRFETAHPGQVHVRCTESRETVILVGKDLVNKIQSQGGTMASTEVDIKTSRLRTILIEGRQHLDDPGIDPDVRSRFLRALECRTPALGRRVFASENEVAVFCNTCKSPACTGCGQWATIHWQQNDGALCQRVHTWA